MIKLKYFLCFFLCSTSFWASAQQRSQIVDYEITFKIVNAGMGVEGSLEGLQASVFFDPKNPEECFIDATANVNTIKTGIRIRDNHLKRSDYFDAEKHPGIRLLLKELKPAEKSDFFLATFDLSIKDITKSFTFPLYYSIEESLLKLSTTFKINRLDFDIGKKSRILSEEVEVVLSASLQN